jgi:hypothetical protein
MVVVENRGERTRRARPAKPLGEARTPTPTI